MPPYVRPSKQIGLRLPPEIYDWVQSVATEEDRSAANVIKRILAAEMAREAKRPKMKRPKPLPAKR
jgi:hypothetical protein